MANENRTSRADELDEFWDIDALIPPRRAVQYARDTDTAEIVFDPPSGQADSAKTVPVPQRSTEPERHFIPPHTPKELVAPPPDEEYTPENSLIRTVRLYKQKSQYRYYEDFLRDAKRLYPVKGEACEHIPFFSYVPQYSQMNRAQLEWYLWWRENFRRGECLSTDYSYLLLHAYELINLAGRMEPASAQQSLCRLWLAYRDVFHQLDGYLPEWICDLSLIHRLAPPALFEGQTVHAAMSRCTLKEFYITSSGEEGLIRGLPVFCSNYDFHKSKFCTEENKPLFERLIYGALREVGHKTGKDGALFQTDAMDTSRMVRQSYQGALCAQSVKRRIAVEYTSFSCSHELRFFITDVIKYAENRIRAHLGVRSRLSIYALSASVREMIDAYLDAHLPKHERSTVGKNEPPAAYERLYDLPRTPLSLSNAQQIERASWDTTERLIEAFEEEGEEDTVPIPVPSVDAQMPPPPSVDTNGDADAFFPYLPFLRAALDENFAKQREAAREMKKMADAVADAINTLAAESFGDVLLEDCGAGYAVIEDYRDSVEMLLETLTGKEMI
ncbi:MAG: TerB N-terminal domain-containing protein [Clostridia bacterium]|nr:TerB N-terminal domain-containing protein [Clostridia bacterium]